MTHNYIKLRIHHFLCVIGFQGKGYSPKFISNFWKVLGKLDEKKAYVKAVHGMDDICHPCPSNHQGVCQSPQGELTEPKIQQLDKAYEYTLGITPGTVITWEKAKKLIALKVSDEDFDHHCAPCKWQKLGICKKALQNLRQTIGVALLAVILFSSSSRAQNSSLEDVEKNLKSLTTPQSLALGKAEKAIEQKHFKQALRALSVLKKNTEYSDAYHFLMGKIGQQQMLNPMRQHHYKQALNLGARATDHFIRVQTVNPSTAFKSSSLKGLGETEILMAKCFVSLRKNQDALRLFEDGFKHLSQVNLLQLVTTDEIAKYAKLCDVASSEVCTSWEVKFLPLLSKADQTQILARVSGLKPLPIATPPSVPYKEELDIKAFQKGFQVYLLEKYEDAYLTWRRLLKDYPRTSIKLRTKFWMGRAAQKSSHPLQAETLYKEVIHESPFSYYALLASWFSGVDISRMLDGELPVLTLGSPFIAPTEIIHLHRAEIFVASGALMLAHDELREVHYKQDTPSEFLVYLSFLNYLDHRYATSFQLTAELSNRGFSGLFSTYGKKLLFPAPYLEIVRSVAKKYGLDPLFLLSIMKQESGFNPDATSTSNAYGLMQLISPTARTLLDHVEVIDLLNPEKNIQIGTKYISELLRQYRSNIIWTLSAYNAGPHHVGKWRQDIEKDNHQNLPLEEYIELIPFRETHDYVENILRNYYWYHRQLLGESALTFEMLIKH